MKNVNKKLIIIILALSCICLIFNFGYKYTISEYTKVEKCINKYLNCIKKDESVFDYALYELENNDSYQIKKLNSYSKKYIIDNPTKDNEYSAKYTLELYNDFKTDILLYIVKDEDVYKIKWIVEDI